MKTAIKQAIDELRIEVESLRNSALSASYNTRIVVLNQVITKLEKLEPVNEQQIERFYLSQDSSCHWYIIPESKREEWSKFNDMDEDDPASWDVPEWANRVGGDPGQVTFENPINKLKP
jgi:hypothetical protein